MYDGQNKLYFDEIIHVWHVEVYSDRALKQHIVGSHAVPLLHYLQSAWTSQWSYYFKVGPFQKQQILFS